MTFVFVTAVITQVVWVALEAIAGLDVSHGPLQSVRVVLIPVWHHGESGRPMCKTFLAGSARLSRRRAFSAAAYAPVFAGKNGFEDV